jgi:hypothetical protein
MDLSHQSHKFPWPTRKTQSHSQIRKPEESSQTEERQTKQKLHPHHQLEERSEPRRFGYRKISSSSRQTKSGFADEKDPVIDEQFFISS